jgi:hypothetical protein
MPWTNCGNGRRHIWGDDCGYDEAMHVIDNDTFLKQAAKQGIALDSRYAEPRTLGFRNDFWLAVPMPNNVRQRRIGIAAALSLFTPETPVWI